MLGELCYALIGHERSPFGGLRRIRTRQNTGPVELRATAGLPLACRQGHGRQGAAPVPTRGTLRRQ